MKKALLLFLLFTIFIVGCKKETNTSTEDFGDSLSEADNAFIESLSVPNPTLREMFGHDGNPLGRIAGTNRILGTMGPVGDLIDKMLRDAQSLSGQKTHLYPQEGNDTTKPAHMGLVYSKGQRDITQRLRPPSGNALHQKYSVYGTDCSGFMINLLRHAGINIDNTDVASFENKLSDAIRSNSTYKNAIVANLGNLPIGSIKSGDFILWIRGADNNHMGIMCKVANGKTLFQSNGTGTPSSYAEHLKNLGSGRGVHPIDFVRATTGTGYWGTGYKILRIRDTLAYNLTNDSTKSWKVNPQGTTTYCGQNAVNPLVAMDDIFIFNSDGTFFHKGGTLTIDPNLTNCYDGGDYNGTWTFNQDQTSIVSGGANLTIVSLGKSRMILITPDGKLDLIPY